MTTRNASCSCGQLTVATTEDPVRVSVCHCLACQRRTGSAFGAQARFCREGVSINGQSTQYVRVGDAGSKITFNFCPTCGATVHYAISGREEYVDVPLGAFADPSFPAPAFSVYEERKHGWVSSQPLLLRSSVARPSECMCSALPPPSAGKHLEGSLLSSTAISAG